MCLDVVSVPVLKASLIWNTPKSGIYKFIEIPYLGFPRGPDYDGGVGNRIFSIPLQTDVVLKPVPVWLKLSLTEIHNDLWPAKSLSWVLGSPPVERCLEHHQKATFVRSRTMAWRTQGGSLRSLSLLTSETSSLVTINFFGSFMGQNVTPFHPNSIHTFWCPQPAPETLWTQLPTAVSMSSASPSIVMQLQSAILAWPHLVLADFWGRISHCWVCVPSLLEECVYIWSEVTTVNSWYKTNT